MDFKSLRAIIWLDQQIGLEGHCTDLKETFQKDLAASSVSFPSTANSIDNMICAIQEFGVPISFTSNIPDALDLIVAVADSGKPIIIITSGTLCKELIPHIQERNISILSYYIFCGNIQAHVGWASDYLEDGLDIQMFDFPLILLIRLARDLSNLIIEEGQKVLANDPESALHYFECARTLAETAVERDKPVDSNDRHRPSTKHRDILDGENGLIAQAKRASEARR